MTHEHSCYSMESHKYFRGKDEKVLKGWIEYWQSLAMTPSRSIPNPDFFSNRISNVECELRRRKLVWEGIYGL